LLPKPLSEEALGYLATKYLPARYPKIGSPLEFRQTSKPKSASVLLQKHVET
jgi:hypothetical protein